MPDDVGDQPFQGGEKPENSDHGAADDEFAFVVFDEAFVRGAEVHEPTAVERMLAAAQSRVEADTLPPYEEGHGYGAGPETDFGDFDDDEGRFDRSDYAQYDDRYTEDPDDMFDALTHGTSRRYRGHARWQRPIAWVLAVVMGIGVVALALTAVYRGAVSQRQTPTPPPPPASSGVDSSVSEQHEVGPSVSEGDEGPASAAAPTVGPPGG